VIYYPWPCGHVSVFTPPRIWLGDVGDLGIGGGCPEKVMRRKINVPANMLKAALAPATHANTIAGVFGFCGGRDRGRKPSRWLVTKTKTIAQTAAREMQCPAERLEIDLRE